MPLLQAEAEKLSQNMLVAGVIENIITSDELYAVLPFEGIDGKAYVYNREKTLGSAEFVETDDTITESAATFEEITTKLRRIVTDVDVDDFIQGTMSDTTDQTAVQLSKKSKKVCMTFADKLINGDNSVNAKEFDGLIVLCPSGQKVALGASAAVALAFTHLDELMDKVKIGGQRVFVMNSRTIRSFFALSRALGGTDPLHIAIPGVTAPGLPSYRGVPILKNDYVPIDQTRDGLARLSTTADWVGGTAYAAGVHVKPTTANGFVYRSSGGTSAASPEPTWPTTEGGTVVDNDITWTAYKADNTSMLHLALDEEEGVHGLMANFQAGIQVKEVGPVQNKDATRWRVRWYTSVALKSELALAMAQGINN